MMKWCRLVVLLFWASPVWAQEAPLSVYTLDPDQSMLAVLIRYERGTLVRGHDHGAKAQTFTGTVRWSASDPSLCDISILVPVRSLQIDPPTLRGMLGLKGETKPKTIAKIEANMLGKRVLDAVQFPDATFQSTACTAVGDEVDVSGKLSIHGIAAPVTVRMKVLADGKSFHGQGVLDAQHSDFEIRPFRALLGAVRNDKALQFHIDVRGQAQ